MTKSSASKTSKHKIIAKRDFPVAEIRRFLEPGPIVLVSSRWKGATNIMTMGWHTVLEFSPSLIGCMITSSNHSFEMIRKSKECVINIPETKLADEVIGIGSYSGDKVDKFKKFNLTEERSKKVGAPGIQECFAQFECKLHDASMLKAYNFFIFEVVSAQVQKIPAFPETLHYRGEGIFTKSGATVDMHKRFPNRKSL